MRERTLKSLFDKIMWYGIYLFPLIAYVALVFSFQYNGSNDYISFGLFMDNLGFDFGPIWDILEELFGDGGGILSMVDEYGFISYANYLVFVTIFHVIFDVIVFVPRLFHDFLERFNGGTLCKK